ncbi:hypothetical protein LSH36_628g00017 [Paralvinella palmiformis]|uniref:Fibrinogen C-terminal domain-containing protein n=1 Tax=Paralvinella palmiformis TaxID=53620 RepID=A0AAD9MUC4_9ANNE|nr:hypothetical protein LSH36_628g00017 [Paralvinella palmiformis]
MSRNHILHFPLESPVVSFDEVSIHPDNVEFLTDDSVDTCALFAIGVDADVPKRTKFRISISDIVTDQVIVAMIGINMGCDREFYVMPLSQNDTLKWKGCWSVCPLMESTRSEDKDNCLFDCQCSGSCREIQLIRNPNSTQDSGWSVCDMSLKYTPARFSCLNFSNRPSGIFKVYITDKPTVVYKDVYCDSETDGGGWAVIMRRKDGSVDFHRDWINYKNGFGSPEGEFWIGNEIIHQLTSDRHTYTLRVDMTNYEGESLFAKYSQFSVGSESEKFILHVSGYDGRSTAGDKMTFNDGCMFSTGDKDNDKNLNQNLAKKEEAPWWICDRLLVTLTGRYGEDIKSGSGIKWVGTWGYTDYAKYVVMMIRPN